MFCKFAKGYKTIRYAFSPGIVREGRRGVWVWSPDGAHPFMRLFKKEKKKKKNVSYFTPNLRFDFDFAVLTIQGSDITLCL